MADSREVLGQVLDALGGTELVSTASPRIDRLCDRMFVARHAEPASTTYPRIGSVAESSVISLF